MRTSNAVENEPIGHVKRVVFILTSCDGHSGLVTAEDDGNERRPMCGRILDDDILHGTGILS